MCDNDPETNPFDDVRHYAYEGDGNTTGSLSSLASGKLCFEAFSYWQTLNVAQCTDSLLKFCHIEVFTLYFVVLLIDGFILVQYISVALADLEFL